MVTGASDIARFLMASVVMGMLGISDSQGREQRQGNGVSELNHDEDILMLFGKVCIGVHAS